MISKDIMDKKNILEWTDTGIMFKRINHRNNHNHNDTFLYTFFIHHRNKVNKTER